MATNKLKVSVTIFSFALIFFLITSFNSSDSNNKYLVVYVNAMYNQSQITVVYEDGKIEEFAYDLLGKKANVSNTQKLSQTLNYISDKGYNLILSSGGDANSTYIFQKK